MPRLNQVHPTLQVNHPRLVIDDNLMDKQAPTSTGTRLNAIPFTRFQEQGSLRDPRRRHGRVRCLDIDCNLGEILDVSASGMRVRTNQRPPTIGTSLTTTLTGLDGPVEFSGVVVWTKRSGFFKFEVGIEFRELSAQMRTALARLARASAHNESMRPAA